MNCESIKERLSAYADKELNREEELTVEEHLKECPACREELEKIYVMSRSLGLLKEYPLPRDMWENIKMKRNAERGIRYPFLSRLWYALPVAAMLLIGLVFYLWTGLQAPRVSSILEFTDIEEQFQEEIKDIYFG